METAATHTATNTAHTSQATVRTRALSAGYHGRTVLDGIDLALPRATLAVLIGANGSGKSTLLRTLAGAQAPLHGTVEICGDDIRALSRRSLAQRLAVVFTDRNGGGALPSASASRWAVIPTRASSGASARATGISSTAPSAP